MNDNYVCKCSELISDLQSILDEYGDVNVYTYDMGVMDEEEKVLSAKPSFIDGTINALILI